MNDIKTKKTFWDRLGISLSGFCAIHCLFFPIAVALLPLWPVAESLHDWTHPILFMLILPTVVFALSGRELLGVIGMYLISGLVVVGAAWLFHDWIGNWGEAGFTIVGSTLLVKGHWANFKNHKKENVVEFI